jgi:hypothetical protein
MRYLLIALLAFAGSAQAQISDRDDDGWRWRGHEWRHRKHAEFSRRRYVGRYRRHWRHYVRDEDRGSHDRETQDGYLRWRAPGKGEEFRGWWRPEGGWRESSLHNGARRCRAPMHAAGAADARTEAARGMAIKSWQEQVINEHGERFLNFEAAYVIEEHCDPARVGEGNIIELKRCVITAAPCLPSRDEDRPRQEEERRPDEEHRQ